MLVTASTVKSVHSMAILLR